MTVYISGPITGVHEYAKAFQVAEDALVDYGHSVINPCKLPHNHSHSWEDFMKEDLTALLKCDGIFMIAGWQESRGAKIEYELAMQLGMKQID